MFRIDELPGPNDEKRIWYSKHAHNDLGMATANTVAAYLAGAECLSVTVNGLGERAGNAALEEVSMALKISEDIDCELNTTLYSEISNYVSEISNRILPESKPITGSLVLSHANARRGA